MYTIFLKSFFVLLNLIVSGHDITQRNAKTLKINRKTSVKNYLYVLLILVGYWGNAQTQSLEFTTGDGNPTATNGPTQNTSIRFRYNIDNPNGNTFQTYTPAVTASFQLTNQQYTLSTMSTNRPVNIGYTNTTSSPVPILQPHSAAGAPISSWYTSNGAATGTGIDVANNYGVLLSLLTSPLRAIGAATSGTQYWMADLVVTFSQPVNDPILHLGGVGSSNVTITPNLGFSTEFDIVSSNTAITLTKLSGSNALGVTGTKINNTAAIMGPTGTDNAANGSVMINGTGITTLTLRVYMRGDGRNTASASWAASDTATGNGDILTIGFSLANTSSSCLTSQPGGTPRNLCLNVPANPLTVTATGATSYQWYYSDAADGGTITTVTGATSASYTPPTTATFATRYYFVTVETSCGTASTYPRTPVTVNANPTFTTNLAAGTQTVCLNGAVTTLTVATAAGNIYQWYSNTTNSNTGGTPISGATTGSYTPPSTTAGTTYYYAVITNTTTGCSTPSNVRGVTVLPELAITTQPDSTPQSLCVNSTGTTLTVTATGATTYQWFYSNASTGGTLTTVTGATSASYTIPTTAAFATRYYYATVGNGTCTVTSSPRTPVTVNANPTFTTNLAAGTQTVCLNGAVTTLTVAAAAGNTYQWYSNTTNSNTGGTPISGATTGSYTPPSTTAGTTYYYAVITNTTTGCSTASNVRGVTVLPELAITTQPDSTPQNICVGGTATTLTVTATGATTYQWFYSNAATGGTLTTVTGATSASYTIPTTAAFATRYYYVTVGNGTCTVTSSPRTPVTVNANPTFTTNLTTATQTACQNTATTALTVTTAAGNTYQWYINSTNSTTGGAPISGAITGSYTPSTSTPGTVYYYAIITTPSTGCSTTSNIKPVTVNGLTSQSMASQTACQNAPANTLSITTSPAATSYQWYYNTTNSTVGGVAIAGSIASTFTPPTNNMGTFYFYVIATVGGCSITSNVSQLTVNCIWDSDGDGVSNNIDLDNDNDGILDLVECPSLAERVSNGAFDNNTNGWTLGSGWVYNSIDGLKTIENQTNSSTESATQTLSGLTNGTSYKLTFSIGAQDFSNAAGNTSSLTVRLGGVIYGIFSNSTLRNSTNVTLALSNGATSNFIPFGTGSQTGYTFTNLTIVIPYTGTNQVLSFQMNGGGDDWKLDNISLIASICDTDGDGIPDYLDLDSDNDGCLDAIEGDENVIASQLVNAGGSLSTGTGSGAPNQNLCASGSCVDSQGVPTIVNNGGAADIGGDQGQGIGESQIVSIGCKPITCNINMYLSQNTNTQLYLFDRSTNPITYPPIGSASGIQYNSIAISPITGEMYGMKNASRTLIGINNNGTYAELGDITGMPASTTISYNTGEIDDQGNYYVTPSGSGVTTMYKINIATRTATTITLSQGLQISDLAYNVNDGKLYSVNIDGRFLSINTTTGLVTFIGTTTGAMTFGAMFGSPSGIFGADNNGGLYQMDVNTGVKLKISDSPASGTNDGAHCVTIPITFDADLYVTKTDNNQFYTPGSNTVYTVVVGNNGIFGVQNAHVTDSVPTGIPTANMTYTVVASSGSSTTVSGTMTGAINDYVSLPVGGTVTYTITVIVPLTFTGSLVNTATITPPASSNDTNLSNNTATDTDMKTITACDPVVWYQTDDDKLYAADVNTGVSTLVCNNFFTTGEGVFDIGFNTSGVMYSVNFNFSEGKSYFYRFNTSNCTFTKLTNTGGIELNAGSNSLSFLPDGTALSGNLIDSSIQRITISGNNYTVNNWYTIADANANVSGGDFILFEGKVYAAMLNSSLENYVYELALDGSYNVTAVQNIYPDTSGLSARIYGMAQSGGDLYGGFSDNTIRKLTFTPGSMSLSANVLAGPASGQIYGMTSLQEAFGVQNPVITSNPAAVGGTVAVCTTSPISVTLTSSLSSGLQWYKDNVIIPGATSQNYIATATGSYTVAYTHTNGCVYIADPVVIAGGGSCTCYKPGATTGGTTLDTKVGITSLGRAGADTDNWPMARKGGWIALEAKTKGFVVNRVAFSDADGNSSTPDVPTGIPAGDFVEGMVVYDTTNKCLKMYTSINGGTSYAWYCISTQTCPD